MDEEGWELLEDLKENISQLTTSIKLISEIMLYEIKKKYGQKAYDKIMREL